MENAVKEIDVESTKEKEKRKYYGAREKRVCSSFHCQLHFKLILIVSGSSQGPQ